MNKLLLAALGAALIVGVGCQNDRSNMDSSSRRSSMSMSGERSDTMAGQDDCPHCPGVQTARADGTCPQCGMKVKTASK